MAQRLGVSRPTYAAIERGRRDLTISQWKILTETLKIRSDLIQSKSNLADNSDLIPRFKQIILNTIRYGAARADQKITKTKLAKLIYLIEFNYFYWQKNRLTGLNYRKIAQGPVADEYFMVIDDLYDRGQINIESSGRAFMISLVEDPATTPRDLLDDAGLQIIKTISRAWQSKNTQSIVDFTHQQLPYRQTEPGHFIDYELINKEDRKNLYSPLLNSGNRPPI